MKKTARCEGYSRYKSNNNSSWEINIIDILYLKLNPIDTLRDYDSIVK